MYLAAEKTGQLLLKAWQKYWPVLLILGFTYHWFTIWYHAIDLPYWDEWETLSNPTALKLTAHPWSEFLFKPYMENRIFFDHIATIFLYSLNGWNLIGHIFINYLTYGLLLWVTLKTLQRISPMTPNWVWAGFMLFLLTPLYWETHGWARQGTSHGSLLFSLLAFNLLFHPNPTAKKIGLSLIPAALAVFSGLLGAAFIVVATGVVLLSQFQKSLRSPRYLIWMGGVGLIMLLHLTGVLFEPLGGNTGGAITLPYTVKFWRYFLSLPPIVFGFFTHNLLLEGLALFFTIAPSIGLLKRHWGKFNTTHLLLATVLLSFLAGMASNTAGRAVLYLWGHTSRYAFFFGQMLPFIVASWWLYLKDDVRLKPTLAAIWLLCAIGYVGTFKHTHHYRTFYFARQSAGAECLAQYYANTNPGECPTTYPVNLSDFADNAKKYNVSFYQKLKNNKPLTSSFYRWLRPIINH